MTAAAAYRKTIHKCARVIESTFYDLHRKGQKENLHEFRLAVKRLRALLPSLPSPPSLVLLSPAFRAAGRIRNIDVQRSILEETLDGRRMPDNLKQFLKRRRKKARRRLRTITRVIPADTLEDLVRAIQRHTNQEPDTGLEESIRKNMQGRITDVNESASQTMNAEQIHALRAKVKEAAILSMLLPPGSTPLVPFEKTADLLGKWHDCVVTLKTLDRFRKKHLEAELKNLPDLVDRMKDRYFASAMSLMNAPPR
jgi:CHAD domain-containing protein